MHGSVSAHLSPGCLCSYLSSVDIVKDKVKLLCSLKRVMEPDQERVFEALQEYIPLCHDVFLLIRRKKQIRILSGPKVNNYGNKCESFGLDPPFL